MPDLDFDRFAPKPQASGPDFDSLAPKPSLGQDFLTGLGIFNQGAMLGTSDEAGAALHSIFGGGDYDTDLEKWRGRTEEFRERNPGLSLGLEFAGGMLPLGKIVKPFIAPKSVPKGVVRDREFTAQPQQSPGLGQRVAQGVGTGSAVGGAYGFGTGEGSFEDRVGEAIWGAGFGGALGGTVSSLRPIAEKVRSARAKRKQAKAADVEEMALENVRDAAIHDLRYGGGQLKEGARSGAQLGPALTGETAEALRVLDSEVSAPARELVAKQAAEASASIKPAVERTLGGPKTLEAITEEFQETHSPKIKAAYDRAYATPVPYETQMGQQIEKLINSGKIPPEAFRTANKLMQAEGYKPQQLAFKIDADGNLESVRELKDVRQLHYLLRGLDDVIAKENASVGIANKTTPLGGAYSQTRSSLRSMVGKAVPEFDEAQNLAAIPKKATAAAELGMDAIKKPGMNIDQLRIGMKGMSPEEKQYVAIGMAEAIDSIVASARKAYAPMSTATGQVTRAAQHESEDLKSLLRLSDQKTWDMIETVVGPEKRNRLMSELQGVMSDFDLRDASLENVRQSARKGQQAAQREYEASLLPSIEKGGLTAAATHALTSRGRRKSEQMGQDVATSIVESLLRPAQADKLTALARSKRPEEIGREQARAIEAFLFGSGLAGTPELLRQTEGLR